jgi:hypothetical protein
METDAPCPRAARDMRIWDTIPKEWREAFANYPTCFQSSDYLYAMAAAGYDIGRVQEVLRAMDPWVPLDED